MVIKILCRGNPLVGPGGMSDAVRRRVYDDDGKGGDGGHLEGRSFLTQGSALKNDLQCQTGGIGIQRRPAIPVKVFQSFLWFGVFDFEMNGVRFGVVYPETAGLLIDRGTLGPSAMELPGAIFVHDVGQ